MLRALKSGITQIKGNSILLGLAAITLFVGLASEGFDRLWGAHFIEGFQLDAEEAVYWFGAFYAIAFLLNIGILKVVETYVKKRFTHVLLALNGLLVLTMLLFAMSETFYWQ